MTRMTWHKRNHRDSLAAARPLTLEERGALWTVLDLIYDQDGRLPDGDERFVCGSLGCTVRVWRRLRARLIDLGRLYVVDGLLRSVETDEGLATMAKAVQQRQEAGVNSAKTRRTLAESSANVSPNSSGVSADNNDLAPTAVEREVNDSKIEIQRETQSPIQTPNPLPDNESHNNKGEGSADAAPGGGRRYAFDGEVIRLNQKHYDGWRKAFSLLSLDAELIARDAYLNSNKVTEEDRRKWFCSTAAFFAGLQRKALALREAAEAERVAKCGTAGPLAPPRRWQDSLPPDSSLPRF